MDSDATRDCSKGWADRAPEKPKPRGLGDGNGLGVLDGLKVFGCLCICYLSSDSYYEKYPLLIAFLVTPN